MAAVPLRPGALPAGDLRALEIQVNQYRCKHCGKVVIRDSEKAWIRSWCESTGRNVHLMKVAEPQERNDA